MTEGGAPVLRADADGVSTLTLSRPARKNAIDRGLLEALSAELRGLRDDPEVKAVVLRGAGGLFSSGIDHALLMEVLQASRDTPFRHLHRDLQAVFDQIEDMERPVIASIEGPCVGLAFELALACDFRVATGDAVLGLPEVAFGIVPDVGGTTRLVQTAGISVARELILTGKLVTGRRGAQMGLLTQVVEGSAALASATAELARSLTRHPAAAVGLAKTLVLRSANLDDRTSRQLEGLVQSVLLLRPELAEGFLPALEHIKAQIQQPEDAV